MSNGTLTVFDLDDTLFRTDARLFVIEPDGTRFQVSNSATHELQPGQSFDYTEFRSAEIFYKTAIPIDRMVQKFKAIRHNKRNPNSRIIIVTAREDYDNPAVFMAALKYHGIYFDDVHIYRAGNLHKQFETTPERKCHVIGQRLESGQYNKARLFDDCPRNLFAFLNMKDDFPKVKFEAYHVDSHGHVSRRFS